MKPIQERAELVLMQALKCVQYRLPKDATLKRPALNLALSLRYGLVGSAAALFVLEMADHREERDLKALFQYWPVMVCDHVRNEMDSRLPFIPSDDTAQSIGQTAYNPLRMSLALRRQLLPIQKTLEISADVFYRDHRSEISSGTWLFHRKQVSRQFLQLSEDSVRYALNFFDRRRAAVDEVPEIALFDE